MASLLFVPHDSLPFFRFSHVTPSVLCTWRLSHFTHLPSTDMASLPFLSCDASPLPFFPMVGVSLFLPCDALPLSFMFPKVTHLFLSPASHTSIYCSPLAKFVVMELPWLDVLVSSSPSTGI